MKEEKYYGIYINKNKIPKAQDNTKENDNYYNKYFESAKLKFEGTAYLIKDKEKGDMEEIKNNSKIKKCGKYLIEFINKKSEVYYINIRIIKIRFLLLLLLLALLLGCFFIFKPNKNFEDFMIVQSDQFSLDTNLTNYVFNVGYGKTNSKTIDLADSVKDSKFIYPGTQGEFFITVSTLTGNQDIAYQMQVLDEKNKPINLEFSTNGDTYSSMSDLAQNIKGSIDKNTEQSFKIRWVWNYESQKQNQDTEDTENGLNPSTYKVKICFVGNENN